MSAEARDVIAAQAVRYVDSWQVGDGPNTLATAALVALKEAGYEVVKLPERCPTPPDWHDGCLGAWDSSGDEQPVSAWTTSRYDPDGVALPSGEFIPTADARILAAALLAAANAAEAAR